MAVTLTVIALSIFFRYSAGLKELVDSMLTVEALERPNIDWVMDKLSTIDRDLQNQV